MLAIRDAGPIRASIQRLSPDKPGLVIEIERLDLNGLYYEHHCTLRPEEVGDVIEALTRIRSAAREASAHIARSARDA